jgi:hypothetical protein
MQRAMHVDERCLQEQRKSENEKQVWEKRCERGQITY